ncbi:MAG: 16S rRNA (adenine(1518)-N(6)/adenine(1519)-N(6))-dimethyltransferase RsmA [bacterium]
MKLSTKIRDLGISPRKKWGQHFVIDTRLIRRIVNSAELQPDDIVVEIGAGLGNLTAPLAEQVGHVYAIEIDPRLVAELQKEFQGNEKIEIVPGDALQLDFAPWFKKWQRRMKVVANLPYEISSPMIFRFFQERQYFSLLVLMLQMEVARRIVALPGTKEYGPLSIWSELYAHTQILFTVSPQAFFPPPRVESAVVKFEVLADTDLKKKDEELLNSIIRAAFNYRRKTILNALKMAGIFSFSQEEILSALKAVGISPQARGEALTLKQFQDLSEQLRQIKEQ